MKTTRLFLCLLFALVLSLQFGVSASAQIIVNGSFEEGLTGWTGNNQGVGLTVIPGETMASDGTNSMDIGGSDVAGSVLSQTFPVHGGSNYLLTFDLSSVASSSVTVGLRVDISTPEGGVIATTEVSMSGYNFPPFIFVPKHLGFAVPTNSSSATLTFTDISPNGGVACDPIIDHVVVNLSTESAGVLVYQDTEKFQIAGAGKTISEPITLYLVMDQITRDITAVRYGRTDKGAKYQLIGSLTGYHEFSIEPSKYATNTAWTKNISGTNSFGEHASFAWCLSGSNAQLITGTKSRLSYPRAFTGQARIVEPDANGNTLFEQATIVWAYVQSETFASNNKNESADETVARLSANLSAKGYQLVSATASAGKDLELP